MRVVLRELAHAHDAVKRAMRLVPVAAAELRHAQRQVAIGFDPLTEHLNMCWAVHRFQRHQVALAGKDWLVLFRVGRSEEHTSELQSLMRISYAVFCLKK